MRKTWAAAGAAVLLAAGSGPGRAEDITGRMQACRAVPDVATRAACYDRIVDDFNRSLRAAQAAPAPRAPGASAPAPAAAAPATPAAPTRAQTPLDQFGAKDLPTSRRVPDNEMPPDEIAARAAKVDTDAAGYMTITLDNGQVWRQAEASSMPVRAGASVRIKSGVLGAYYLTVEAGNKSVRVKRLR